MNQIVYSGSYGDDDDDLGFRVHWTGRHVVPVPSLVGLRTGVRAECYGQDPYHDGNGFRTWAGAAAVPRTRHC